MPRRYEFDNHLPDLPPPTAPVPVHRPEYLPQQPADPNAGQQIIHIHQAPPDRTVQRLALGSGVGAGTVAAGVYFGPLLVAAMTSMAIDLAVVAVVVAVSGWAVVTVVRSIGGPDGKAALDTVQRARKPRGK
ncbi:DUF6251 family protein [Actinacidiphila sp. ITFR-21]|uniref:DUF6251 family protein n=1 Tax=Actinacidiphila sp. ITFR-21 TaxID=3075199 RepID=UPI00288B1CBB|nr:DUF6251 family protein [Streptomyces sp. ITFR-21]WNI16226.1 DUF6251 family protein [Streptomyces sp. ITFR-21]